MALPSLRAYQPSLRDLLVQGHLNLFAHSNLFQVAVIVFPVKRQAHNRLRLKRHMEGRFVLENEDDRRGPADLEDANLAEDLALQVVVGEGAFASSKSWL